MKITEKSKANSRQKSKANSRQWKAAGKANRRTANRDKAKYEEKHST